LSKGVIAKEDRLTSPACSDTRGVLQDSGVVGNEEAGESGYAGSDFVEFGSGDP
jgi:hypothetical protein